MKIIALLIITASLNISLLNKNNEVSSTQIKSNITNILSDESLLTKSGRIKIVKVIKQKLLTHVNKIRKQLIDALVKTHIITSKEAKSLRNHTFKPISKKPDRVVNNLQI